MKKTIIDKYQLDHLVDIGVLYKSRDGTYHNLIDHKVWGEDCMPDSMVDDVAGKTVDVKVARDDGKDDRWVTDEVEPWYIQPWMLNEYYDRLKQWGKCRPVPFEKGTDPGINRYIFHIITKSHLDKLVEEGIVTKKTLGDGYVYRPIITDMGGITMHDIMAEQICGRTLSCKGTGTSWIEQETEHQWAISQWMLDRNYPYLLSRKRGLLNTEEIEDEEEEEKEGEKEVGTRNHVDIAGKITEKTDDTILISTDYTDVLVHIPGGYGPGVGHLVNVEGHLVRTSNMMGYPEIQCNYIQEV